ncbi:MAG: hypothetical protein ACLP7Q_27405 [Isosphaeraceae bacterium]
MGATLLDPGTSRGENVSWCHLEADWKESSRAGQRRLGSVLPAIRHGSLRRRPLELA